MKTFLRVVLYAAVFGVLFVPLVVSNELFFPFITAKNIIFRVLVEVAVAAWIALAIFHKEYRPRFSWILAAFGSLIVVMLFANMLGENPARSLWSNYERMDGYVTLLHFFAYFVVLGSVFRDKITVDNSASYSVQTAYFVTALIAALAVSFNGFEQISGTVETTQGWRINATLGNAAYMAVYMLFNVFVAMWLFLRTKNNFLRLMLISLAALFVFFIVQTATRGTIVGVFAGVLVGCAYIALFTKTNPAVRKYTVVALVTGVVAIAGLFIMKDSSLVQDNAVLSRATNISFSELDLRIKVWNIALEGVKERPLLGWGQENFIYVFNEYYDPQVYWAESWYDRAHNVFMDWLVAGGVLGLIAYLAIFATVLYYIFVRPLLREDDSFTVAERGVLLGIVAGYFVHNLVVFDHVASLILFAAVLAIVHSRVSQPIARLEKVVIAERYEMPIVVCVLAVGAVFVYAINAQAFFAARDVAQALAARTPEETIAHFDRAFSRNTFGNSEIAIQEARVFPALLQRGLLSPEQTNTFAQQTVDHLAAVTHNDPRDARAHMVFSGLYRAIGNYEGAAEEIRRAYELSPTKPSLNIERGLVAYDRGLYNEAEEWMLKAYELAPENPEAQIFYSVVLFQNENNDRARAVLDADTIPTFVNHSFAIQVAAERPMLRDFIQAYWKQQISFDTNQPQPYLSLAEFYVAMQEREEAVATIEKIIAAQPSLEPQLACIISNIEAGVYMYTTCSE